MPYELARFLGTPSHTTVIPPPGQATNTYGESWMTNELSIVGSILPANRGGREPQSNQMLVFG